MNETNIQQLKASPLFNMSLSSKELFHSNFLIWAIEKFPEELGTIVASHFLIYSKNKGNKIINPKREDKNIDLSFELNGVKFIVENKVKSIPNREQLQNYKTKFGDDCCYVLLCFVQPSFDLESIGWKLFTYDDLSSVLKKLISIKNPKSYPIQLLNDYVCFVDNLSSVLKSIQIRSINENFNFYNKDFTSFQEIRIHDLFIKQKYSQLLVELQKFLTAKGIDNIIIDERYKGIQNTIVVSFNLVNGKGVVNIDYSFQKGVIYGIMLDGLRYVHYVYCGEESGYKTIDVALPLKTNKLWFLFDQIEDSQSYPRKGKNFNKFGTMLYRSIKISSNISIEDIFKRIFSDLKKIETIGTNTNHPINQ